MTEIRDIIQLGLLTMLVNVALMLVKIVTGLIGNSHALVSDGIESASDVVVSLITWIGFYISIRPPDRNHPYGHGRMESLAGMFSGIALMVAALTIAVVCISGILSPHSGPAWYTLPVLVGVVVAKEFLARKILALADGRESRALEGDAWHHRSDALTSGAAALGIGIALVGGERFASADDWAALFACSIILFNGFRIIASSLHENLDGRVNSQVAETIRQIASNVNQVRDLDKCNVRKSGTLYFAELHVEVDPDLTVAEGHRIGHHVKEQLLAEMPQLADVVIHLEPFEAKDADAQGYPFDDQTCKV